VCDCCRSDEGLLVVSCEDRVAAADLIRFGLANIEASERDIEIFLAYNCRELSFQACGRSFDLCTERVRQIEYKVRWLLNRKLRWEVR